MKATHKVKRTLKSISSSVWQWSADDPIKISQIASSMIGMIGPIIVGGIVGNVHLGLLAAFGAMVVNGTSSSGSFLQRVRQLITAIIVSMTAIFTGSLISEHSWLAGGLMVLISATVALLGGMSRPAAVASTQFILFMIIGTGVGAGGSSHPLAVAFIFSIGSLWGAVVSLLFKRNEQQPPAGRVVPLKKRLQYWWKSLRQFSGWHYTIRVVLCLSAAEVIAMLLHQQKSYWIALTVAIVLHRNLATAVSRTYQRGIGTSAGVLVGSLLLINQLPPLVIYISVALLGGLRPIFKKRNYAIYAMLMTPLMVILFSLNGKISAGLLFDRLLDTLIGCIISLVLGYYIWPNREITS